jgi:small conductance mechanosensitive channel
MQNTLMILLEQTTQGVVLYIPKLLLAIFTLIVGFKTQSIFDKWLTRFFEKHDYDPSLERFTQSLLGVVYKIAVIFLTISVAGIQTTSIVAAIGAAGFAVGLALQGSMSNFASGILILTLKPIKVGEFIEISGNSGSVDKIEIFNTTLLTVDNKTIIIPNSDITSNVLINYARQNIRRVDLEIGVGYDSKIEDVKKVISTVVHNQGNLVVESENRKVFIRVSNLGDSAVIFSIKVWCKTKDYLELKHNLLEEIKETLDKEKIDIPYQTLTIKK